MTTETMTLTYSLNAAILLKGMLSAGASLTGKTSRMKRWAGYLILFLVIVCLQVGLGVAERALGWEFSWSGFIVGAASVAVIGIVLQRRGLRTLAESACAGMMRGGPVELTISTGGLVERSGNGRLEVPWSSVDHIGEVDGAAVIRIAAMCIVIPDTALPGGMGRRVFIENLDARRNADAVFG